MKRYWKIITLPALILVIFSVYYIQPIITNNNLFELKLVMNQDVENLDENIIIAGNVYESQGVEGDYYDNVNHHPFELSSEGMIYQDDLSYFERLNQLHPLPKVEQLQKDYRSFMRGKHSIELLFEDEDFITYTGPHGQNPENGIVRFDISILEKETNEEDSFSIEVPLQGPMSYVMISDVQLLDGQLYVLTTQYGQMTEEVFNLYQIDAEKKVLVESRNLNEDLEGDVWLANDYQSIDKETHYVFRKYENVQEESSNTSFISYHIESGKMNTIDTPDDWYEFMDIPGVNSFTVGNYTINEDFMYFIHFTEDTMVIEQYNLLDHSLAGTKELTLDTDTIDGLDLVYTNQDTVTIINSRATQGTKERTVLVIDLKLAEILYEADIEIVNTAQELQVYDIEFYQVHLN